MSISLLPCHFKRLRKIKITEIISIHNHLKKTSAINELLPRKNKFSKKKILYAESKIMKTSVLKIVYSRTLLYTLVKINVRAFLGIQFMRLRFTSQEKTDWNGDMFVYLIKGIFLD